MGTMMPHQFRFAFERFFAYRTVVTDFIFMYGVYSEVFWGLHQVLRHCVPISSRIGFRTLSGSVDSVTCTIKNKRQAKTSNYDLVREYLSFPQCCFKGKNASELYNYRFIVRKNKFTSFFQIFASSYERHVVKIKSSSKQRQLALTKYKELTYSALNFRKKIELPFYFSFLLSKK